MSDNTELPNGYIKIREDIATLKATVEAGFDRVENQTVHADERIIDLYKKNDTCPARQQIGGVKAHVVIQWGMIGAIITGIAALAIQAIAK